MATATEEPKPKTKADPSAMKIIANRMSLLAALSVTAPIAAASRFKDILQDVLISADPNHQTVLATDMNVVARHEFEADVDQSGQVLAPGQLLRNMLAQMPDEMIVLAVDPKNKALSIKGERTQHKLATADHRDYPAIPAPDWKATCKIPAARFAAFLRAVLQQVGDSDFKGYAIQNLLVEFSGSTVALVGTDGRSVAMAEFSAEPDATATALVPNTGLKVLLAVAGGEVALKISDNWIAAETDRLLAMARLAEGRFPRWRGFAPPSMEAIAEIVPSSMIALIKRTCVAPPDAIHGARVWLTIADGTINAKCEVGGYVSESEIPAATPGTFKEELNWRYLLEALSGLAVVSDMPAVLRGNSPMVLKRDELTYAIVPLSQE